MVKKSAAVLLAMCILLGGCGKKEPEYDVEDVTFHSAILSADIKLKIYLPPGYSEGEDYPVLYFLPDYGGSAYTVMDQYDTAQTAQRLIQDGRIAPIIIAAIDMDRSFGLNSADTVETVESASGKLFEKGRYEDYFIQEIVPFIDERYKTDAQKDARYIGGYSMGGFAALHISLRNPDMFSKAGGHSPSIFIDSFPDETVTDFLYPTEAIRSERDPIYLVREGGFVDISFFLDVESGGSAGVKYLYDTMIDANIEAQYSVMGISHSRMTCSENMEEYLIFYAGMDGAQNEGERNE